MRIFFFSTFLILTLGLSLFFLPSRQKEIPIQKKEEAIPASRFSYQTDTDGDGVPDWEEKLRGTDPTRPDRPRVAQPEIIARLQEKRAETIVPVTPLIVPLPTQEVAAPKITSTDITALHTFGNALGSALLPVANQEFESKTLALFNAVIAKKEKLSALASAAAAYTVVSAALKETAAPPQGGGAAVLSKLSASYEALAGALASLARDTTSDPKQISKAWLVYSDAALGVGKALNETIGFFAARGISFSPAEPGALFNTY